MSEQDMSDTERETKSEEGLLRPGYPGRVKNNLNNQKNINYQVDFATQCEIKRLRSLVYALGVVLSIGIVILVVVISVLFGKLSYDVAHHTHQPKVGEKIAKILEKEELCVPCENYRLGPSFEEDQMLNEFTRKHEPEGDMCCVETPKQLLTLLELYVEKRYRQEKAREKEEAPPESFRGNRTLSEPIPVAHLMGTVSRLPTIRAPSSRYPINSWIHDADLAFTKRVEYRHGRIVVPSKGYYYVYSQVSFLDMNYGDAVSNSLSHYLYRYNIIYPLGGEEKLIQDSFTKCNTGGKTSSQYSSYLGALFHLRRGDEIFVKVSNITSVFRDPKLNYFGLFKVADSD